MGARIGYRQSFRSNASRGDERTDVIDGLTIYPDVRRQVLRLLAEIDAAGGR